MLLQARENLGLCSDSIRDRHKLQWSSQGITYLQDNFELEKINKKYFKLKVILSRVTTASIVNTGNTYMLFQ